ncbi:FecR family protein [Sphingobacterium tabacisoli]|uniref:FecR family protein n=1 Tax=Sphingobacterium tabacisoli TaxID=2044855 RepID=A0ABW5L9B1_9SPHI|nr:FecR family protein [Sphingobacterium tabacisoli]
MPLTTEFKHNVVRFLSNQLDQHPLEAFLKELQHVDKDELVAFLTTLGLDDSDWEQIADQRPQLWHGKLNKLWENIDIATASGTVPTSTLSPKKNKRTLQFRIWTGVAATLLTVFGLYWYLTAPPSPEELPLTSPATVYSSENISKITLPDGKVVVIQENMPGTVYQDEDIHIVQSETGELKLLYTNEGQQQANQQMNRIHTSKGGFTKFLLEDGTKVYLNSESTLRFPLAFKAGKREVYLEGEGYFEVVKNPAAPFVVHTAKQAIEVLGTTFNIKSYAEENTMATTLIEGTVKVRLEDTPTPTSVMLRPGEQATVHSQQIQVQPVRTEEYVGWIQNRFIFSRAPLEEVLRDIERWYDIEFVHKGAIPPILIEGSLSKNVALDQLLTVLSVNTSYKFSMKGRRIFMDM